MKQMLVKTKQMIRMVRAIQMNHLIQIQQMIRVVKTVQTNHLIQIQQEDCGPSISMILKILLYN